MNLCLACREVRMDGHGGLPRSTCDLASALAQRGHSVQVLTDVSDSPGLELPNVMIKRLPVPPASGACANARPESAAHNLMHSCAVYREVRRMHEQEQAVDAVLAPLWRSEGAICLLDNRFPTIVSCMTSLQTLTEIEHGYQRLPDIDERLSLEREVLSRSRYLHGLTEAALAKTIGDYQLSPDATAVIGRGLLDHNGHNSATSDRSPASSDRPPNVLFVGRMERRKGIDTLLAAARALVDDGLAVSFTMAGPNGDPWLGDSFEREVTKQPRLREAVRFAGAVSDEELHRLYASCDIVCVPSRYESHGVVLIEAMMFGKPIVTCDTGGISEVVQADYNALVLPSDEPTALAQSLRELVVDSDLRAHLGAASRESYERRFQVRSAAQRMEWFIQDVAVKHRELADASKVADAAAEVRAGLGQLLHSALALPDDEASRLAVELLDPPAEAWRVWLRGELAPVQEESKRLEAALAAQEKTMAFLLERHETLRRVEEGGWWRLRGRLLPALRVLSRVRQRTRARSERDARSR